MKKNYHSKALVDIRQMSNKDSARRWTTGKKGVNNLLLFHISGSLPLIRVQNKTVPIPHLSLFTWIVFSRVFTVLFSFKLCFYLLFPFMHSFSYEFCLFFYWASVCVHLWAFCFVLLYFVWPLVLHLPHCVYLRIFFTLPFKKHCVFSILIHLLIFIKFWVGFFIIGKPFLCF